MSKYKHVFFDLDHTLWDYDANATDSLYELYERYDFYSLGVFGKSDLARTFFEVNYELWDLYNEHKIHRADIRKRRFPAIFERLGAMVEDMPKNLETEYVALCPTKDKTFKHAHAVLDYLSGKYNLHVITNGFDDIQETKLKSSGIRAYFDVIVTSETANNRKPSKEIFELALNLSNAQVQESIMIGDNLGSDIQGAINVGMDHIWFNPHGTKTDKPIQHEIENLLQLKTIL